MKRQRICKHILFFSTHKATAEKNKKSLQANAPDSAVSANLERQSNECKSLRTTFSPDLKQLCFVGKAGHQLTESLAKILKKGALVVNQSVVLLMKCVQAKKNATEESGKNLYLFVAFFLMNICASNPPFLKLRQALMR